MIRFDHIINFIAYSWFMFASLIGSVIMFRFLIASPLLTALEMGSLYNSSAELMASILISALAVSKGRDQLKSKIREEDETNS